MHGLDMEGVHFRNSSADGVVRNSKIYDTGNDGRGMGEGVHVGSAGDEGDRSDHVTIQDNTGKRTLDDGYQVHSVADGWGCDATFQGNRSDLSGASGADQYAIDVADYDASTCRVTVDSTNTVTGGRGLTNPGVPVG